MIIYDKYTEKIRLVGKKLIDDYLATGHVKTGINGPYDDPETEVRNLSHLIIITAIEYMKFGKVEYKALISKMASELVAMKSPDGTYKMRQKEGKDQCNGVIGHAWLMEGLMYAYKATKDAKYIEECNRIASMHKFQPKLGLWGRPMKGNDDNAIDYTFNHQLWYAATLAELNQILKNNDYERQLDVFFSNLHINAKCDTKGRIKHSIIRRLSLASHLKVIIKDYLNRFNECLNRPSLKYKEVGYHFFNLMAFARLFEVYSDIYFWKSEKYKKMLLYINNKEYQEQLVSNNLNLDNSTFGDTLSEHERSINIYGYAYNVIGFEAAFCRNMFSALAVSADLKYFIDMQFDITWSEESGHFGDPCHDCNTVNYRVYEMYKVLEKG